MAWTLLPIAADAQVLKAQFDEVRAAIIERRDACGLAWAVASAAADGAQPRALLTGYRGQIETLIPYFGNPLSDYAAFTKATCLTKALARVDWYADQVPATMFNGELNELRLVLNELSWLRIAPASSSGQQASTGGLGPSGQSDIDWDTAWGDAKNAYAAQVWEASPVAAASYGVFAYAPSHIVPGSTYELAFNHSRTEDLAFAVPDVAVNATRMLITNTFWKVGTGGASSLNFNFYPQANFGGVPVGLTVAGPWETSVVAMPAAVRNATNHYSIRSDPETPNHDNYRPDDNDGDWNYAVLLPSSSILAVQLVFTHEG